MNEEKVKKYSKDGMICCGIITIISIVGFICITIFDHNISDIAVFCIINYYMCIWIHEIL